jgi:hypothetical protein
MNARAYFERLVVKEEADGIAPALVESQRLEARAAIAARDERRLRAKGFLQGDQEQAGDSKILEI